MLSKAQSPQGAFARVYKLYQKFQTERFKSQNASEGKPWKSLSPAYAEAKKKRFRSYPGSGSKMMIATGTLAGAVIGPGAPFSGTDKHRAMFTKTSMVIEVAESGRNAAGKPFNYAAYANEERPFMEFSQAHMNEMQAEIEKFILGD